MTDETANLVLEHLKNFQAQMSRMDEAITLMRMEITAIRHDLASLRTMQEAQSIELASIRQRLDRVETRLGLVDELS